MRSRRRRTAAGFAAGVVALVYAALAGLWILVSDRAVSWFFRDPNDIAAANIVKGWLFVGITALLLYGMLSRVDPARRPLPLPVPRRNLPFLLTAALIVAATALGVGHIVQDRRDREGERLQATVDVKAQQVSAWLRERMADAEFVQGSREFASLYRRWDLGDAAAGDRLMSDLLQMLDAHGFVAVTILDGDGNILWRSPGAPADVSPMLGAAVRTASEDHRSERAQPYIGGNGRIYLDFVAPLIASGSVGFAVLHVDPAARLYPMLQDWHRTDSSGETVMLRRDGDGLLFLNALRHRRDAALRLRVPVAESQRLVSRAARMDLPPRTPLTGLDYRQVASFGAARSIPGTDWFLVTKVDHDEVFRDAYRDAMWLSLAGVLALFVTGVGMVLLRQRDRLTMAEDVRRAQSERLQAMRLFDVVASSSSDAIFAKDLQGRYLLFNREAERVTGRTSADTLGKDDRAVMAEADAARVMANDRRVMEEDATFTFEEDVTTRDGVITYLATKGPLHDETGAVVGVFGISRDITERKKAEVALRDSEARFRTLFENASVAITIHDVDTGGFVDANRHAIAAFGYDSLVQLRAGGLDHEAPYSDAGALELIRSAAREGAKRFEWKFRDRDAGIVWFEALLNPIVLDGVSRVMAICVDITASKAADDAMRRQTDELKAYAAELERFNRATVGRELDMIELKRQVNALSRRLGEVAPYDIDFADAPAAAGEPR